MSQPLFFRVLIVSALLSMANCDDCLAQAAVKSIGVPVTYQLPTAGPLPKTYRVTLAITDPMNPDWIVSTFVAGEPRTVTAENQGRFSEIWDGLDENFMPVPPGEYGVKGIMMPAKHWKVDGLWHSVTPKFVGGASPWLPSPEQWEKAEPFGGDPVGSPLCDVAVGANGVAVFCYRYLENGTNYPLIDLKKPLGHEQFIRAFNSGGAAGGSSVATDGENVWAFSSDGGPKFVFRADGKSFGKSTGANRSNGYLPEGWVTAMAVGRDSSSGKSLVCLAQRGKIVQDRPRHYAESKEEFVDKITIHDGDNGAVLSELRLARPQGLVIYKNMLYALHAEGRTFVISAIPLATEVPEKTWHKVFAVPVEIVPNDFEIDSRGSFYISDSNANKVFKLSAQGKLLRVIGKLTTQKPGTFDPETLMSPGKLATWVDAEGNDRLLIVDNDGPNRTSEWSSDGKYLREFMSLQTKANDGYAFDPQQPEHVYLPGQNGWLTRFHVDFSKGTWKVDAVWPYNDHQPRSPTMDRIQFVRLNSRIYFACRRSYNIYRLDSDRVRLSAAILREREGNVTKFSFWHDANGNEKIDNEEITAANMPTGLLTYHGQNWLEDLSLLAPQQGGTDVWRLAPSSFDSHGNPIFKEWKKVLTDPVFVARLTGKIDAIHGGNELSEKFTSDWMGADGNLSEGVYVQARGGKNFSANEGAQHKLSRYVPAGEGGYQLKWRVGRSVLNGVGKPSEMYGGMRVRRPINGLVSVMDQSLCGILLYTDEGMYVDTIFPDGRRFNRTVAGIYPQPGEFFAGQIFPNARNGKIYFAMGKYTPLLFEAEGWSLEHNPVQPLNTVQKSVTINASQIAEPSEMALSLRGGPGTAKFARFSPALGEVSRDRSLLGWESCEPVVLSAEKDQKAEVRCLYQPDRLLLRWHVRLPSKFIPKPMPPVERIFTHDQMADTVSFYFQGDENAKPGGKLEGRPGDARFIFGIFKKGDKTQPVSLGLYPEWTGPGKANPQVYRTPVGQASFAHAGEIAGATLSHVIDEDGKGFVLVTDIPRSAIPRQTKPFEGNFRTLANFEATIGGHTKFWWANSDGSASRETYDEPTEARLYPGSWAPIQFQGLEGGVAIRNWIILGPFGGPGAEKFRADPNGLMPGTNKDWKKATQEFCESAVYPPDDGKVDLTATFQGEQIRGYWNDPRNVRWRSTSIAELDNRVILGPAGQIWYGAAWIQVPHATKLDAHFQSHPMTHLRWYVNGDELPKMAYLKLSDARNHTEAKQAITLRAGWNQIHFRGYCVGYPPFRAGLVLSGPEKELWGVSLSATPPK